MPFYEFEHGDGEKRTVFCSIADLPGLVERMERVGWRRLYSIPQVIVVPGYHEATEETHRVMAEEEVKMAGDRKEAAQDLHQLVREELR